VAADEALAVEEEAFGAHSLGDVDAASAEVALVAGRHHSLSVKGIKCEP